jgi:hypothetical protein
MLSPRAPARQVFPLALALMPFLLAHAPAASGAAGPQPPQASERSVPTAGSVQAARDALTRFAKGDPGWQVRMRTLVAVARTGPVTVPVLVEALKKGDPVTREFAAQALVFVADPTVRPALEDALDDPAIDVRFYACAALSMYGRLAPTPRYRQFRDSDQWAVRRQMGSALARDDVPDPAALRTALAKYDPAAMDSARLGRPAPDFKLNDLQGKPHRLSDFRGKKDVLLIFLGIL